MRELSNVFVSLPSAPEAPVPAAFSRRPSRRRGAVLLMILVLIVVLAAMLVQFTEKGMAEIAAEGHYVERERLRTVAYSALETTLAVLADVIAVDGGLTAPAQGWDDPLGVAGFATDQTTTVHVGFVDESGRLPLAALDENTLVVLFAEMGFSADEAFALTQKLLDWADEDDEMRIDGAESEVYAAAAEWPYAASNRTVQRLEELAVIDGFRDTFFDELGRPNIYFQTFAGAVSVYADGNLNVNSASDLALRVAGSFGDAQVHAWQDYRAGPDRLPGTGDDRYFASPAELRQVFGELAEGLRLGVEATVLRVVVEVAEKDGGRYALEAVVQRRQGDSQRAGATAANARRNPARRTAAGSSSSTGSTVPASVTYPFVFLELTEDVGHNDSIARPADDTLVGGAIENPRGDRAGSI